MTPEINHTTHVFNRFHDVLVVSKSVITGGHILALPFLVKMTHYSARPENALVLYQKK